MGIEFEYQSDLYGLTAQEIEAAYDRGLRFEEMWKELRDDYVKLPIRGRKMLLMRMTKKAKEHFPEGI